MRHVTGGRAGARRLWLMESIAGAALLIGAITVAARLLGFGRNLVFARTVGQTCLGTAYLTANHVPTIVFEIVAGGALTSIVVPVLAGPIARGAAAEARQTASALLTWSVLLLAPLVVGGVFLVRPVVSLLVRDVPGCATGEVAAVAARMLVVFLPQLLLYGVAVVLYGVLQAHRRFLGPAAAPLLSSVVVIACYLVFVPLGAGSQNDLARLSTTAELVLSVGTTMGVGMLVVAAALPAARLHLRLRPTLAFPAGVAARVRGLALAGVATVGAQQATVAVVIVLANSYGGRGTLPLYTYAWSLFLLPYSVLAVPIATSAFPTLSARAEEADERGYDETAARTTRAVVLLCCAAAAALAAAAAPTARVFVLGAPGNADPAQLAWAVAAFAPGLVGYGLVAHLGRALYACRRGRAAAGSVVAGWAVVVAVDIVVVRAVPREWVVAGLGFGNTVGMTVAGALLLVSLRVARGSGALAGLGRATVAGTIGGAAGYAVGAAVVSLVGDVPPVPSVGVAVLAAGVAIAAFAVPALLIDGQDVRSLVRRRLAGGR